MSSFIVWLKKHVCEDDAWITVHPNASGPGRPVLLDDEGYIKGGMGGKFNGQRIDLMPRKQKSPPSGEVLPLSKRYTLTPPAQMTAREKTATEWGHTAAEAAALSRQRLKDNSTENETKYNNWVDEANELMRARTLPRPEAFTAENVPETFSARFNGVDTLNTMSSPQAVEAAASKAMFDMIQETGKGDLLKQPPEQMRQSFAAVREKLAEEKAKFEEKAAAYQPEIAKREEALYKRLKTAKTGKTEIGIEITRLQDAERRIDAERELFERGEQMINDLEKKYTGGTASKADASRAGYPPEVRQAAKKFDDVTDPRKMWHTYQAAVSEVESSADSEKAFKRAKHDLYVEMQNADKMLRSRLSSEVKAKHHDISPGQKRLFFPVFIERETEKAYGVRNDVYYQAKERLDAGESERDLLPYERTVIRERKSLNWYPKSRTTAAEGHIIGAEKWLTERNGNMAEDGYCLDAAPSHRHFDENGFLHVDSSHITKEQVVKYYGREIPGWQALKLDPERLYNVYRPADEIEKSTTTFNGLPLLLTHHIESADEPQKEYRVGSVSAPVWNAPYLDAELHITDKAAIDAVENGEFKEISAAYLYEPVLERGTFDGTDYEIVMRNIRGNHVALVREGRAGPDVVVADEQPAPAPLRSFAAWMRKNPLALKDAQTQEWENTKAAMDDAWITVHPNASGPGRPVLLDDEGYIKGGMGGKFNGQRIDLIPRKPKAPPDANAVVKLPSSRYNIPKLTGGSGGSMEEKGEGFKKIPPAVSAYIKNVLGDSEADVLAAIENNPDDLISDLQNQLNSLNWNERMLRNAGKTEKADKAKQEREQFQEYVDKLRGTSPDTTREYMQKLVDLSGQTTKSKERIMSAFDVRQKNYPIPDNQERVGFPPKVVGETDKAYEVREANPFASPFKNVVNEYLPKSRVTMKDGYVIGVEGWLKKKIDIAID